MGDTNGLFIWILSFWVLVILLTNTFTSEISGQQLTNLGVNCLKPYSVCPNIPRENLWEDFVTGWFNALFNIANQIPVINLLVPLLRIMSFSYHTNVPTGISIILDAIAVISGLVGYKLIKES